MKTTGWNRYGCVVDVLEEATGIFISNILEGRGELSWADMRFEEVDTSVPTTGMLKAEPQNLDFPEQ